MGLKKDQILALLNPLLSAAGAFYTTRVTKVELTFTPIPDGGTLSLPTGVIVSPPAGQFVFVPLRIEYVSKTGGGDKGVGISLGYMHFTNGVGTPDLRMNENGWNSVLSTPVEVSDMSIASSGEISVVFSNGGTSGGWAKAVLSVGGPFVTVSS